MTNENKHFYELTLFLIINSVYMKVLKDCQKKQLNITLLNFI